MITDTALIFEGGGMRASYTAGAVVTLLEEDIRFADVYGISAGSSHTVNYISNDIERAAASFVDLVAMPGAAGLIGLLNGRGYFNAEYVYERVCLPDEKLPFDFGAFLANPARPHIEALNVSTGETAYWGKDDMGTLPALMRRVRASSTMPFFMPKVEIDGHIYADGGLGDSWGIPLARAKRDGYKKFFIVRTQARGYRKSPEKHPALARLIAGSSAIVRQRMLERHARYNEILDEIDGLEEQGAAYVFYPRLMPVKNTTIKLPLLRESYRLGLNQARGEVGLWRDFL